ncbi:flavin reductase family protein [Streptomyces aidingensis]|uniref:NADH-FMN oxidoreductase RutF, flavin reductase (DIM6/NTAB) family n=1 Tax=Streptomyces aidingensis TaxID=910347 RepID=A0A1I1HDE2_9ACTN|nr:flavin reductase family protein [Streptomyces aidingensis]SFC19503.1 NADH-FMN oxidoreductase RutF, flavin reductase (DIM6/NTAB) family [Streptomyces aidingensis]
MTPRAGAGRTSREPLDPRRLRGTLGRFATGVTVVTYTAEGGPRGVTMNSFTSVSMDPPLVLVSVARSARAARWLPGRPFAVNVLAAGQRGLALHFAGRPDEDLAVDWAAGAAVPRLHGVAAWLECLPWATYHGGDHLLVVGEVAGHGDGPGDGSGDGRGRGRRPGDPLLFHAGEFHTLGPAPGESARPGRVPPAPWLAPARLLHEITEPGLAEPAFTALAAD